MIKSILFIVFSLSVYSLVLKKYFAGRGHQKEVIEAPKQPDIMEKNNLEGDLGPEVGELQRYRHEMLQKVNEINGMIKNPEKMIQLKKIISENKGLSKIKGIIENDQKYLKVKKFLLNFGESNAQFFESGKTLSKEDSKFFEVNKPMSLEEYKKKFDIKQ